MPTQTRSRMILAAAAVVGLLLPLPPAQSAAQPVVSLRVQTPVYQLVGNDLSVPGYDSNAVPGAPALPVWSTVVELPPEGDWWIEQSSPEAQVLAQSVAIAAVPTPDVDVAAGIDWVNGDNLPAVPPTINRPDPAIYGTNAFYPSSPVVAGAEQWQRGRRLLALRVFPFQYNPVTGALRYHPDVQISIHSAPGAVQPAPAQATLEASNPAASTPGSLRIRTGQRGLYRLSYDELLAAGVPLPGVDPASFAFSYLGQPVAIEVSGEEDGRFDPGDLVIFYAQPYEGRYQTDNVYWFSYGDAPGLRMATRAVTPTGSEPLVTTITQTLHAEFDRLYQSTFPRPRDADHWFDTPLSPDIASAQTVTRSYELALDDALAEGTLRIRAALHGGANRPANPDKSIAIALNGHPVATHQWEGLTYHLSEDSAPAAWLDGAPNRLHLVAGVAQLPGIDFYSVSPDWVRVSYPALADAEGDAIYIEGTAAGANQVQISGWSTPEVQVYELRDPDRPVRILTTAAEPAGGGYSVSFWDAALPGPTYALSTRAALRTPLAIEPDTPSSWGTPDHEADYIAIVHPSLQSAIDPLLAHRAAEGLRIAKVDVQDIYDEFSYGRRDPEAIRSFLSYAYHHWNTFATQAPAPSPQSLVPPPQYVLLVGDGHYDFTGVSGVTLPNLIPPYLAHVDPWMGETLADNRYVTVDGPDDILPDMAIGRIPANTPADVAAVADKVIAYEAAAPAGAWQERVVFVADSNLDPAGNFHAMSDDVRLNWLPAGYDDRTIYYNRDYFSGPAMNAAVIDAFNQGALLLQWNGHSSRFRWGAYTALNYTDPPLFDANDRWPATIHYTCFSGYFGNLAFNRQALGEVLLLTPQRGAIADMSPSGQHVGWTLLQVNQGLAQALFQERVERMGPAIDAAKLYYYSQTGGFLDVIDTMIHFGDPALKMRLPGPQLAGSTLAVSRAWAPPGVPITVTATLTSTAAVSATAQLTLPLPAGLGEPTNLGASSAGALYDPISRQITWSGAVAAGAAEWVAFRSALLPEAAACAQATVAGQARDGLAALTPLAAAVQAVTPDVDCDGDVDIADIQLVTAHWGAAQGDPAYHPRYDLDGDDAIDTLDVVRAAIQWQ